MLLAARGEAQDVVPEPRNKTRAGRFPEQGFSLFPPGVQQTPVETKTRARLTKQSLAIKIYNVVRETNSRK